METGRNGSEDDCIYFAGDAIDYFESMGNETTNDRKRLRSLENHLGVYLVNNNRVTQFGEFGTIFDSKVVYLKDISLYFENNKIEIGNNKHIKLNDIFEYLMLANKNFDFITSHYTSYMRSVMQDDT